MIKYYALFDLLNRRNMKRTDLLKVISSPTLAKLSKGQNVQTDVIEKICDFLDCQPGDIMEYYYDENLVSEDGVVRQLKPMTTWSGETYLEDKYVSGPKDLENKKDWFRAQLIMLDEEIEKSKSKK